MYVIGIHMGYAPVAEKRGLNMEPTKTIDEICQHDPLDEGYWCDLMVCPWHKEIDECKYRYHIKGETEYVRIDKVVCAYNYRKDPKENEMTFDEMLERAR